MYKLTIPPLNRINGVGGIVKMLTSCTSFKLESVKKSKQLANYSFLFLTLQYFMLSGEAGNYKS
jgi:hypothetical protein